MIQLILGIKIMLPLIITFSTYTKSSYYNFEDFIEFVLLDVCELCFLYLMREANTDKFFCIRYQFNYELFDDNSLKVFYIQIMSNNCFNSSWLFGGKIQQPGMIIEQGL